MADYVTTAEVRARTGITTSLIDDTDMSTIIAQITGYINDYLLTTTNYSSYTNTLKKISIDLVAMFAIQKRQFLEANLVPTGNEFYTVAPDLTNRHLMMLDRIYDRVQNYPQIDADRRDDELI